MEHTIKCLVLFRNKIDIGSSFKQNGNSCHNNSVLKHNYNNKVYCLIIYTSFNLSCLLAISWVHLIIYTFLLYLYQQLPMCSAFIVNIIKKWRLIGKLFFQSLFLSYLVHSDLSHQVIQPDTKSQSNMYPRYKMKLW